MANIFQGIRWQNLFWLWNGKKCLGVSTEKWEGRKKISGVEVAKKWRCEVAKKIGGAVAKVLGGVEGQNVLEH